MRKFTHITKDGKYHARLLHEFTSEDMPLLILLRDVKDGSELFTQYAKDFRYFSRISSGLDLIPLPEVDENEALKEAEKNGARIQVAGLFGNWITLLDKAGWHPALQYRIDPEWLAEQNKLYAWDVYAQSSKTWFRVSQYYTACGIEAQYPKSKGYLHVRCAEFVPPEEVK